MFENIYWKDPQIWGMNSIELKGFWCFVLLTIAYYITYFLFSLFYCGFNVKHLIALQATATLKVLFLMKMGPFILLGYLILGAWLPVSYFLALRKLLSELERLSNQLKNEGAQKAGTN